MAAAARCLRSLSRSSTGLKVGKLDALFDLFSLKIKPNLYISVAVILLHIEEYLAK